MKNSHFPPNLQLKSRCIKCFVGGKPVFDFYSLTHHLSFWRHGGFVTWWCSAASWEFPAPAAIVVSFFFFFQVRITYRGLFLPELHNPGKKNTNKQCCFINRRSSDAVSWRLIGLFQLKNKHDPRRCLVKKKVVWTVTNTTWTLSPRRPVDTLI